MVSMLLIATVGMASFDWINTNLQSLGRIQGHRIRQTAIRNAVGFMEAVNPMENPRGETRMGKHLIRWNARLREPARDGVGPSAGIGLYRLGLYDTHVEIETDGKIIADFELRQTGYHQEREFRINF